jgi:hypothetical protein
VRCAPDAGLHVWVRDGGPGRPRLRQGELGDDGGRGLPLVNALRGDRGVQPVRAGNQVWFILGS